MAEGMGFILLSALVAAAVTIFAARRVVARAPERSAGSQIRTAAMSFPTLAVVIFAIAVAVTLFNGRSVQEPGGTIGMVIFAMVFFLIYALVVGAVVGIPTAIVAVRAFRKR